jgi:hypothetical protein
LSRGIITISTLSIPDSIHIIKFYIDVLEKYFRKLFAFSLILYLTIKLTITVTLKLKIT